MDDSYLLLLRDSYFRMKIGVRKIKNRLVWDAPIPIYRPLMVDPAEIEYTISWQSLTELTTEGRRPAYFNQRKPNIAGTVLAGGWDRDLKRFDDGIVYRSFVNRFDGDTAWEATELYREAIDEINGGTVLWGCSTPEEFDRRCEYLDELYATIESKGYRAQGELDSDSYFYKQFRDTPISNLENEIVVNIGRDGEIIFQDGRNRLSIAKVLGLESIPVIVLVRHVKWQELRDTIVDGGTDSADLPPGIRSHPDIAYLE